jgi:hypothetical protein
MKITEKNRLTKCQNIRQILGRSAEGVSEVLFTRFVPTLSVKKIVSLNNTLGGNLSSALAS